MNVLLDTCALLALSRGTLPVAATAALRSAPEATVSVVSLWEVAIMAAAGRLLLPRPPLPWFTDLIQRHRLHSLPLDEATVCEAAALPPVHGDPIDRVLIALAKARHLPLVTSDQTIARYPGIQTFW